MCSFRVLALWPMAKFGEKDVDVLFDLAAEGAGEKIIHTLKKLKKDESVDSVRQTCFILDYYSSSDHPGRTLLHAACAAGNLNAVKALLELGASPAERTPPINDYFEVARCWDRWSTLLGEASCLHLAAASGNGAVVELLLSAGAGGDINARSGDSCTPLMTAAKRPCEDGEKCAQSEL